MQARTKELFTTIRTEGAILPADLLQRISEGRDLDGLKPDSYHLIKGQKLNEVINHSWLVITAAWKAFRESLEKLLPTDLTATSLTRERWLLPLFTELGYGRLPAERKSREIEGKEYPISHFWQNTPIHLVGCKLEIDKRTQGIAGAARTAPHSLVQEFLNRSDDHLWAFVSNGLRLRILRDNSSLTRQAYVEFDLESMMEGEVYSDFTLLWLLCHQSRVEGEKPEQCWLEKWSKSAAEQGVRALDNLRKGVEEAIATLGRGFLAYRTNNTLKAKLRSGELDKQDYYRQLLRVVYRLLFLFVAEDRELLLDPKAVPNAKTRFRQYYSTQRLRSLALKLRGTPHPDLWQGLRLVMHGLGQRDGISGLGVPALGSFLWSDDACPDLGQADISNADLLTAIRDLAIIEVGGRRRVVDFKNLRSEELGSVYEALLELHPDLNPEAATFELRTAGGSERKTTGSYYTHERLVQCVLDSALDPVVKEALKDKKSPKDAEAAILKLKVCDPASGSGHFLIAAAHRLAKHLATIRTGDEEPSPQEIQRAMRDVVGRCLYGVDINPMSVELCKIALWLEAIEPGKPLSFLDPHIQCGNSLIGATPALINKGIPDDVFDPVEGDDKAICSEFRALNKNEHKLAMDTLFDFAGEPWKKMGNLAVDLHEMEQIPDDTFQGVLYRQQHYEHLVKSQEYRFGQLLCDAWCAAFVWKKTKELPYLITEQVFRKIEQNPNEICNSWVENEIQKLANHYRFFHWHLAFPDVFRIPSNKEQPDNTKTGLIGGFDFMFGNPPWDALSPDLKEFFSAYDPAVRSQDKEGQALTVNNLLEDPVISAKWKDYRRDLYASAHFLKNSGRFTLYAPGNLGKGDFNVFRMFVELSIDMIRSGGWASQVVPDGLYSGANSMAIRKTLFEYMSLSKLFGFENCCGVWFPEIHRSQKFCIYSACRKDASKQFDASFNIQNEQDLSDSVSGHALSIPVTMIIELSPEALAIPEMKNQFEIDIMKKMYSRWPKFGDESAAPPIRQYMREIDMGNDRELFTEEQIGLPVYEGRMVWHFDHRAKGYRSGRGRKAEWVDLSFSDPTKSIQAQWHIRREDVPQKVLERINSYRIGFCDVASPTNERSLVAAMIPPGCIAGHKVPTIMFRPNSLFASLVWLAVANSFSMDFLARQKVSLTMSYTLLDSLPFPRLNDDDPICHELARRALRLTCTGPEMNDLWNQMAETGLVSPKDAPSPGITDEYEREVIKAEIEAIVATKLFGLTCDEIDYILETFPIVKRRDVKTHGVFKTKGTILASMKNMPILQTNLIHN